MTNPVSLSHKKSSSPRRPCISVIIPAFNHESFIADAIESVLSQSFEDFELIVIDDGSTDDTYQEIVQFEDPRMQCFQQENRGAAAAINRGIQKAKGRFISILNSDDLYHPERLEQLVELMEEHPDCMIASSTILPIDQTGQLACSSPETESWLQWYENALSSFETDNDPFLSLLRNNFLVSTSNFFIRSKVFETHEPFNEILIYCHDYEFLLRMLSAHEFRMIREPLLYYRLHEHNTIREHEFLRHLEVLHSIFTSLDIEGLLDKKSLRDRCEHPIFQGLLNNPEINPEKFSYEYLEIIKDKGIEIEELTVRLRDINHQLELRETRLVEADRWMKDLKNQAEKLSEKLKQSYEHADELNRNLQQTRIQLQASKNTLHEIYSSKGWLWLTRYRKCKVGLKNFIHSPWRHRPLKGKFSGRIKIPFWKSISNFMMGGEKRLLFYRKVKASVKRDESAKSTCGSDCLPVDASTTHAEIIHPLEKDRPVIVHALANFMTGGSSRLVVDLFEHIGHRYEQEIITFFVPKPLAYSGVPIQEFPRSSKKIAEFLKNKKVDLLHVHYWGDCDDPWYNQVFTAAREADCMVVENINTPVAPYIDDTIDYYVYVSEYARNFVSEIPEPTKVIFPGSNLDTFSRNGTPIPDDVIGMVYRLEGDKLREDSIRVFIEVVRKRPATKALIVGGGSFLESYRRQVAQEKVSDNFRFTGYVPYSHLPDYYREFSVFVAPVWKESFGQVSPFAMGMEIPVVGYNVGALPEILGGKEFLGETPEQLADIIIDLLDNREKRLLVGKENRRRAMENFSLGSMVSQYDQLYQRLLKE